MKTSMKNEQKKEKTTTELTIQYIQEHPYIKSCLKKGLLNYSSLARLIAKELHIEKKTSKEAILIAARRFKEALKHEMINEEKIRNLLARSEIEMLTKINVFIVQKDMSAELLEKIEKRSRQNYRTFFITEGSSSYTLIMQEQDAAYWKEKIEEKIIAHHKKLALIMIKSTEDIEMTIGTVAFLTSLFAENGVNIIEFLSCWTDTIFIIQEEDTKKALDFLNLS